MLMAIADDKEALKRQMEAEHPEWREPKYAVKPIKGVIEGMLLPQSEPIEDYDKGPW